MGFFYQTKLTFNRTPHPTFSLQISKKSIKISCSNLWGLNSGPKVHFKMMHILSNLDSDIKIVIDSHCDDHTLNLLRKDYKLQMSQYDFNGNLTKNRGILVLTKKNCGFTAINLKIIDIKI